MDITKKPELTFNTKDDAIQAKTEFASLLSHPAWIRLVHFLDETIEYYMEQLRSKKVENLNELYRIREKRDLVEKFRNTPEIIMAMIETSQGTPVEFDPYLEADEIKIDR